MVIDDRTIEEWDCYVCDARTKVHMVITENYEAYFVCKGCLPALIDICKSEGIDVIDKREMAEDEKK